MPQRQMEISIVGHNKIAFTAKHFKVFSIFLPIKEIKTYNGIKSDLLQSDRPSFEFAFKMFRQTCDIVCSPVMFSKIGAKSEGIIKLEKSKKMRKLDKELKQIKDRIKFLMKDSNGESNAREPYVPENLAGLSVEELKLKFDITEKLKEAIEDEYTNENVVLQTKPTDRFISQYDPTGSEGVPGLDSNGNLKIELSAPQTVTLYHEGDNLLTMHLLLLGSVYAGFDSINLHTTNEKDQIMQFNHSSVVRIQRHYSQMLGVRGLKSNLQLLGSPTKPPITYMFDSNHNQDIRDKIMASPSYRANDRFLFDIQECENGQKIIYFNTLGEIYVSSAPSFQGQDTIQRPTCSKFDKAYQSVFNRITIGSDIMTSSKDMRLVDTAKDETVSTKNNDIVHISSKVTEEFSGLIQKSRTYREKLLAKFISRLYSSDTKNNQTSFLVTVINYLAEVTSEKYIVESGIRKEIVNRANIIIRRAKRGEDAKPGEEEFVDPLDGRRKFRSTQKLSPYSCYIKYLEGHAVADNVPVHLKPLYIHLSMIMNGCYRNNEEINLNFILFGLRSVGKSYLISCIINHRISGSTNQSGKVGSAKSSNTEISQKGFVHLFHEAPNIYITFPKHAAGDAVERQEELKTTLAEGKTGYSVFQIKEGKRLVTHYLTEAMRLTVLISNADNIEDYDTPILTRFMLIFLAEIPFEKNKSRNIQPDKLISFMQALCLAVIWSTDSNLITRSNFELSKLVIERVVSEYCNEVGLTQMDQRKTSRTEIGLEIRIIHNAILKAIIFFENRVNQDESVEYMVEQFLPRMLLDIEENMHDNLEILDHTMSFAMQDFVEPLPSRIWITGSKQCGIIPVDFLGIGKNLQALATKYKTNQTKIKPMVWFSDDDSVGRLLPYVNDNGDSYNRFVESVLEYLEVLFHTVHRSGGKCSFRSVTYINGSRIGQESVTNDRGARDVHNTVQRFLSSKNGEVEHKIMYDLNYIGYAYEGNPVSFLNKQIEHGFPEQIVKAFFNKLCTQDSEVLKFEPISNELFNSIMGKMHDNTKVREILRSKIRSGEIKYTISSTKMIIANDPGKPCIWMSPKIVSVGNSSTFYESFERVMSVFKPSDELVYTTRMRLPADHKQLSDEGIGRGARGAVPSDLIFKPRKLAYNGKFDFIVKRSELSPEFIKTLEIMDFEDDDDGKFNLNGLDFDEFTKKHRKIYLDSKFAYRTTHEDMHSEELDLRFDEYLMKLGIDDPSYDMGQSDQMNYDVTDQQQFE